MARPAFKPSKKIPDGSTKAVIAKLYDDAGGAKEVAFLLGLGIARTYQIAEEGSLTLDQAARLSFATGSTAAADYMAALTGGLFLPVASTKAPMREMISRLARDAGEAVAAGIDATADAELTNDERGRMAAELDDLVQTLVSLRRHLGPVMVVKGGAA